MRAQRFIATVDSHTAGHPTRVVTGGLAPLIGESVAARRDDFRARFDDLRTFLLHEPRGHAAMVGVVLTESRIADFGAIFLGSYGYLDMCGHATIGLARTLDFLGLLKRTEGLASFTLEVPAGVVTVRLNYEAGDVAAIGFDNVPARVAAVDGRIAAAGLLVPVDIAYGGNWYGLVAAEDAGIDLSPAGVGRAMQVGSALKTALNADIEAGLYGTDIEPVDSILFHDTRREDDALVSRHLVVLASNKFDRSPCGTGTSARLAQLVHRGTIASGERIVSESVLGTRFAAKAERLPDAGPLAAIQPTVTGLAHITGQHGFLLEAGDPLPHGFLCR